MSIPKGHYCFDAAKSFSAWVDQIVSEKHINKGCGKHMKQAFNNKFSTAISADTSKKSLTLFINWAEKAQKDGHLTTGNLKFVKDKVNKIILKSESSTSSKSSSSLEAKIAKLAKKNFVAFYDKKTSPVTEVFGNFYEESLTYKKQKFRCAEAAFQAQKFTNDPKLMKQFEKVDGDGAYRLARANNNKIIPNWHKIKFGEMKAILQEKFKHPVCRKLLLATGKSYLVENNPKKGRDTIWSDDHDGTGENNLGKILMEVRGGISGHGVVVAPKEIKSLYK